MTRAKFMVGIILLSLSIATALAQDAKKSAGTQQSASIPKAPQKLSSTSWNASTDATKPDIVTVAFDLRQLSVLQGLSNIRFTVKYSGDHTDTETFHLDFLQGGIVTVAEFKTKLKFSHWEKVKVEGQSLDGTVEIHAVAYQEPKSPPEQS